MQTARPVGIATADACAHHVAIAAMEMGKSFPKDVGLIGHDCHLWHASTPVPKITNITISHENAGQLAVEMACDLLDSERTHADPVVIPPELIPGETTGNI